MYRLFAAALLCAPVGLLGGCGGESGAPEDSSSPQSPDVLVAVASNFVPALAQLQPLFEATGNYELSMSVGSTGKLYAQVRAGAPYDVLLAADQERPRLLEQDGLALERFVYAEGQLVLWQPHGGAATPLELLRSGEFARLVLANPKLAPYGVAAEATLKSLGVYAGVADKLAFGENLGQAHAMLATGNAKLGFTAQAFLPSMTAEQTDQYWRVPATLHEPIRQEAVVLQRAADNRAALAFVAFLRSAPAREVIASAGYLLPPG